MSGKVFHVSEDIHAAVKSFCKAEGLASKEFVESTLREELRRRYADIARVEVPVFTPPVFTPLTPKPVPVEKKPQPVAPENSGDEPWTRAPFWSNQQE